MNEYMGPVEVSTMMQHMRNARKRAAIGARVDACRRWQRGLLIRPPGVPVNAWDWVRLAAARAQLVWERFGSEAWYEIPLTENLTIARGTGQNQDDVILFRGRLGTNLQGDEPHRG